MFNIGLVGGMPAPDSIRRTIADALALVATDIVRVSRTSRFNSFATCKQNDVVLVKDADAVYAGQVQMHFEANGVPVSMIDMWELHSYTDVDVGYAIWKNKGTIAFIDTALIIDVMTYQVLEGGMVGTILPFDSRASRA